LRCLNEIKRQLMEAMCWFAVNSSQKSLELLGVERFVTYQEDHKKHIDKSSNRVREKLIQNTVIKINVTLTPIIFDA